MNDFVYIALVSISLHKKNGSEVVAVYTYFGVAGSIKRPTLSQPSAVFSDANPFNFSTTTCNELDILTELNFLAINCVINLCDISCLQPK